MALSVLGRRCTSISQESKEGGKMDNGQKISTGQLSAERDNDNGPRLEMASRQGELPVWSTAEIEMHERSFGLDDWQRVRDRIACLETIIAILIEKNERMRQQLALYAD
jgi:hypothetical protein